MEVKTGLGRVSLLLSLALVGLLSMLLANSALAAPAIGKGGQISACYVVKGKAKGAMRVVPAGKRCKRGERKLAWSIVGVAGPRGESGTPGERGQQGAPGRAGDTGAGGAAGAAGATIAALEGKVESLEDILDGVQKGDLSGAVGKLSGITGVKLNEAVDALPVVSALTPKVESVEGLLEGVGVGDLTKVKSNVGLLCTQTGAVTDQVNSVGSVLNNLLGTGLLSGLLGGEKAPDAVPKVSCTA